MTLLFQDDIMQIWQYPATRSSGFNTVKKYRYIDIDGIDSNLKPLWG